MCKPLITIVVSLLTGLCLATQVNAQAQFWLSSTVPGGGAVPIAKSPEIENVLGSPTELHVWALPEEGETIENFSLNVVSTSETVLQLDSAVVHNAGQGGDRFEIIFDSTNGLVAETGFCDSDTLDFENIPTHAIWGIRGFTLEDAPSVGLQSTSDDQGELLATISVTGLSLGSTELYLQIGEIGINQAAGSTAELNVKFGINDQPLNAETQRCQSSTSPEATIQVVEMLSGILGDFNSDGLLDATDIDLLSAETQAGTHDSQFDITGDALVSESDRTHWVTELKGTFFGDANFDGGVGFDDFLVISANFSLNGGWALGDFNGNGNVNFADFLILSESFGKSGAEAASVPEPSTSSISLIALATLLFSTRPRRRRAAR